MNVDNPTLRPELSSALAQGYVALELAGPEPNEHLSLEPFKWFRQTPQQFGQFEGCPTWRTQKIDVDCLRATVEAVGLDPDELFPNIPIRLIQESGVREVVVIRKVQLSLIFNWIQCMQAIRNLNPCKRRSL